MLLPALQQARAQGRKAGCLSNLKQLAAATLLYSDDFDGYIFSGGTSFKGASTTHYWNVALPQYFGMTPKPGYANYYDGINQRLSDYSPARFPLPYPCPDGWTRPYSPNRHRTYLHYGMNYFATSATVRISNPLLSKFARASETMLFVDNYNPKQAGGTGRIYIDMNAENRNTEPFKKDIDNPHLSGTNVVFSDGHTQHYPKTTVYGPEDSSFKSSKTGTRFWIPYN